MRSTKVTLFLCVVCAVGACGGDDNPGGNDTASSGTAATGGMGGAVGSGGTPGPGGSMGLGGGGAGGSVGEGGSGGEGWTGVPTDRPLRLLFIGNSFTLQGPIPNLVRDIASSVGWPTPEVDISAVGGQSLGGHRQTAATLANVDAGSWDFVIIQDHSLRATDNAGDPPSFKDDATWFYDRIKASSPAAEVVLYETWARHADHGIYPGTFVDPLEMQAQIRVHYNDAANNFIPMMASHQPSTDVRVAPVGDAWENHLAESEPLRLHGTDDYHAGLRGRYLNALVLYSTAYGVVATGVSPLAIDPGEVARLQTVADATTGITQVPPAFPTPTLAVGQSVQIDFGTISTPDIGWNVASSCGGGGIAELSDASGAATGVDLLITTGFASANESGLATNGLGYPGTVSSDVCWLGSFDGHAAALLERASLELRDVDAGTYDLTLFASRTGDDGGLGRLTRYEVSGQTLDLEVSSNQNEVATFSGLSPDAAGTLALDVLVSPAGTARFGYLGALVLTKTGP